MLRFPDDTQDSVEQLYAGRVLEHFANYGRFWERFVGQRADPQTGTLRPYGLIFPASMGKRQQKHLNRDYELLCMQHYSVFVHLAGAHYQARELARALKLDDESKRHFRHWEAYDVALLHLGTAISLGRGLIVSASRLTNVDDLLAQLVQHQLWKGLDRSVRLPRNDVVHYSRRLHRRRPETGDFEVLREPYFESRRAWSQDLLLAADDSKWIRADEKLKKDIADTETLLNDAWAPVIEKLEQYLASLGVAVSYGAHHSCSHPLPITPAVDTAQPRP